MWGTGETGGNVLVYGFGLFFFALGVVMIITSCIMRLYNQCKDRKQRKQLMKKALHALENPIPISTVDEMEKGTGDLEHQPARRASCDLENPNELSASDPRNSADDLKDVTTCETEISVIASRDPDASTVEPSGHSATRASRSSSSERNDDDVSHDSGIFASNST